MYEKPELKFVSLRNEEAVAKTCWGYHGKENKLYCDIPDKGFVSFQIGAGSCTLNVINVQYYGVDTNGDGKITEEDTPTAANADQIAELKSILEKAGGNVGNAFQGEGSIVFPDDPGPSWS